MYGRALPQLLHGCLLPSLVKTAKLGEHSPAVGKFHRGRGLKKGRGLAGAGAPVGLCLHNTSHCLIFFCYTFGRFHTHTPSLFIIYTNTPFLFIFLYMLHLYLFSCTLAIFFYIPAHTPSLIYFPAHTPSLLIFHTHDCNSDFEKYCNSYFYSNYNSYFDSYCNNLYFNFLG